MSETMETLPDSRHTPDMTARDLVRAYPPNATKIRNGDFLKVTVKERLRR